MYTVSRMAGREVRWGSVAQGGDHGEVVGVASSRVAAGVVVEPIRHPSWDVLIDGRPAVS